MRAAGYSGPFLTGARKRGVYFFCRHINCKMKENFKTGLSILIILMLLPYVAVVFRTGSMKGIEGQMEEPGLEMYVMGILPGQMPAAYEEEALKAQAVVIRTNLLRESMEFYGTEDPKAAAASLRERDLQEMGFTYYTPGELEELWGYDQFEWYEERIEKAVEDTAGEILAVEGKPVDLPFHAVSAGRTREGSLLGESYTYLEPVECPGDVEAADYLKIQTVQLNESLEIRKRDEAGYVTEVRLGEEVLTGEEFRSRFSLNSSCFTAERVEDGVRITTKGLGHGLGLSMYQANLQALKGCSYLEILSYFYKNVECISSL